MDDLCQMMSLLNIVPIYLLSSPYVACAFWFTCHILLLIGSDLCPLKPINIDDILLPIAFSNCLMTSLTCAKQLA